MAAITVTRLAPRRTASRTARARSVSSLAAGKRMISVAPSAVGSNESKSPSATSARVRSVSRWRPPLSAAMTRSAVAIARRTRAASASSPPPITRACMSQPVTRAIDRDDIVVVWRLGRPRAEVGQHQSRGAAQTFAQLLYLFEAHVLGVAPPRHIRAIADEYVDPTAKTQQLLTILAVARVRERAAARLDAIPEAAQRRTAMHDLDRLRAQTGDLAVPAVFYIDEAQDEAVQLVEQARVTQLGERTQPLFDPWWSNDGQIGSAPRFVGVLQQQKGKAVEVVGVEMGDKDRLDRIERQAQAFERVQRRGRRIEENTLVEHETAPAALRRERVSRADERQVERLSLRHHPLPRMAAPIIVAERARGWRIESTAAPSWR